MCSPQRGGGALFSLRIVHTLLGMLVHDAINNTQYKGSAWVPAYASAHAPGRAGQRFDLFGSLFDRE